VVSIGYPGRVRANRPVSEPHNLGHGWVKFDYEKAFGVPVKIMNDAAMQALGSYGRGTMLFLGLGTGLGTALVVDGTVVPMELGHLSYQHGTYEDYFGLRGKRRQRRRFARNSKPRSTERRGTQRRIGRPQTALTKIKCDRQLACVEENGSDSGTNNNFKPRYAKVGHHSINCREDKSGCDTARALR
jgi:hypothetical protein